MTKNMYLNLAVKDLQKSKAFFTALGFSFNKQFTNNDGACLVLGQNIYAMLLTEKFFKTFTAKQLAETGKTVECIICIDAESREAVDEIVKKAFEAGAGKHNDVQDHGWMYANGFEDLDGHLWEIAYMDANAAPQQV